jgi:transcriptional regulator of acetoin/glycerol metabolism
VAPDLASLRTKYERLLALRELHDRAKSDASFVEPDPRAEMTSLARTWPGSLRELDELPLDVIRTRISALDGALRDPSRTEQWMIAQAAFHRLARGALSAKRWLGKRKRITSAVRDDFDAHAPRDARAWREALADVASPPRGRLMDLVFARLASELHVSIAEARRLVR